MCNGNGDTCKTVSGFFDERNLGAKSYQDIVTIPKGATMIRVLEKRATNNYLGTIRFKISVTGTKIFCVNSNNVFTRCYDPEVEEL